MVDIIVEIVEPLFAARVGVGGHQGCYAKRIHVADLVDIDCAVDFAAGLGTAANDVRNLQTGDVERFGR